MRLERRWASRSSRENAVNLPSTPQEERVLYELADRGTMTMSDMIERVPELSWSELFTAIDRLSRSGSLILSRRGFEYQLRARHETCPEGLPILG